MLLLGHYILADPHQVIAEHSDCFLDRITVKKFSVLLDRIFKDQFCTDSVPGQFLEEAAVKISYNELQIQIRIVPCFLKMEV